MQTTQLVKIWKYLKSGKDLTTDMAERRFGVKSLSRRIHELRLLGLEVYTTRKTLRNGRQRGQRVTVYTAAE